MLLEKQQCLPQRILIFYAHIKHTESTSIMLTDIEVAAANTTVPDLSSHFGGHVMSNQTPYCSNVKEMLVKSDKYTTLFFSVRPMSLCTIQLVSEVLGQNKIFQ